jgi:hypothetical protein
MKVVLKKGRRPGTGRKPPRLLSKIAAIKLRDLEVGYIYPISKAYFRSQTYMGISTYLRKVYQREFVLFAETSIHYIVKRVKKNEETATQKEVHDKYWRVYLPKRQSRYGKVEGGKTQ